MAAGSVVRGEVRRRRQLLGGAPRSWDPAGFGIQRHVGPPEQAGDAIIGDLEWIRPDRETVALREHREISTAMLGDDAYALDWDVTLRAPHDVVLDRTPHDGTWGGYSGLALRGRADWTDTRLLLTDGEPKGRVAPQRSRWCDLSSARAGVCILDHPENPGHPVDFYASCRAGDGYGDGWANTVYPAILWNGPRLLPAGESLRLRYRVVVHDGAWTAPAADAAWEAYAGG